MILQLSRARCLAWHTPLEDRDKRIQRTPRGNMMVYVASSAIGPRRANEQSSLFPSGKTKISQARAKSGAGHTVYSVAPRSHDIRHEIRKHMMNTSITNDPPPSSSAPCRTNKDINWPVLSPRVNSTHELNIDSHRDFSRLSSHRMSSVSTMRRPFWLGAYRVGE